MTELVSSGPRVRAEVLFVTACSREVLREHERLRSFLPHSTPRRPRVRPDRGAARAQRPTARREVSSEVHGAHQRNLMDSYQSLIERLELLCDADRWQVPSSATARLATIIERAELGQRRIESFVRIEQHPVFLLLELPTVLQVHVLSQLPSYAMAVAAQICKTCWDAIPEAARTRMEALGARRLPPLFKGEALTQGTPPTSPDFKVHTRVTLLGGSETTSRDWLMRGDTAPPPEEQADWKSHSVAEVRAGAMWLAELSTFAWRTRHRGVFARHVYSMCDEELRAWAHVPRARPTTDRGRHDSPVFVCVERGKNVRYIGSYGTVVGYFFDNFKTHAVTVRSYNQSYVFENRP